MHIAFVAPTQDRARSRADRYNHAMVDALRADGHAAEIVDATAWRRIEPDAPIVVDGRLIGALAADIDALIDRRAVGLVHDAAPFAPGSEPHDGTGTRAEATAFYGRLHRIVVAGTAASEHLQAACGVATEVVRLVLPGTAEASRVAGSDGSRCALLACTAEESGGHGLLIAALARLFDLDWHLTIVTDAGPEPNDAAALRALIAESTVANRVTVEGPLTGAALEAAWQGTDLFVGATASDGYATPFADALRRGIPVAMTADERARALVGPDMGAVCLPGDRDTLSKSLRRMIFDTELRRVMADAAWARGQALPSWPAQARAFTEALRA